MAEDDDTITFMPSISQYVIIDAKALVQIIGKPISTKIFCALEHACCPSVFNHLYDTLAMSSVTPQERHS